MKVKISSFILTATILLTLLICCDNKDKAPGPVSDFEGNTYKTVRIGSQVWMAESLRTRTFNDGTEISYIADAADWGELTTPGFCWYNNDEASYKDTFGALYNFYAVISGNLCPAGWHVPSRDEWQQLRDVLGDTLTGGGKLKEEGTLHWNHPNSGATNITGFTAMPAGIRYLEGTFSSLSSFTSFWSSTVYDINNGWYFSLYYNDAVAGMNKTSQRDGFSVRCVKD
jgi:uncharacterized protein (TIGR02145 family)